MAVPLRRGEGGKGCAIKEKRSFFFSDCEVPTAIKLEEGALMALPLTKKKVVASLLSGPIYVDRS